MSFLRTAWGKASRRQKVAIAGAGIVSLLALSTIGGGGTTAPDPEPAAAAVTARPTIEAPSATHSPSLTAAPTVTLPPTPKPTVEPTPEPTVEPTPEPTAEPTPDPVPEPDPTAEPEPTPEPVLALAFTKFTSPINRGANATAALKTKAGARCSIIVEYKSGPSTAAGLGDKTASSKGAVSWTWKVGTRTTPGSWPVTVSCFKGDLDNEITRNLKVR